MIIIEYCGLGKPCICPCKIEECTHSCHLTAQYVKCPRCGKQVENLPDGKHTCKPKPEETNTLHTSKFTVSQIKGQDPVVTKYNDPNYKSDFDKLVDEHPLPPIQEATETLRDEGFKVGHLSEESWEETLKEVMGALHILIKGTVEKAYEEGYVARGGVESEQKQRMFDAGKMVGRSDATKEIRDRWMQTTMTATKLTEFSLWLNSLLGIKI